MKHMRSSLAVFLLAMLAACSPHPRLEQQGSDKAVKVVASFSILGDMVKQIGGDQILVKVLVGANGDAHVYEPSPGDAKAVSEAKLVVMNGLHFDAFMSRLLESSHYQGAVCVASKGVIPIKLAESAEDPHAWQDMGNAAIYAENIASGLAAILPGEKAPLEARKKKYLSEIKALDSWCRSEILLIAPEKRKVISSHDAFGYFAAAYGVRFVAPVGWSTEGETPAKNVAAIVAQVKREKIRAIFSENMNDPRLIQQIARDAGAVVGGELYSDSLSAPGKGADTYLSMFRLNVQNLVQAMARN